VSLVSVTHKRNFWPSQFLSLLTHCMAVAGSVVLFAQPEGPAGDVAIPCPRCRSPSSHLHCSQAWPGGRTLGRCQARPTLLKEKNDDIQAMQKQRQQTGQREEHSSACSQVRKAQGTGRFRDTLHRYSIPFMQRHGPNRLKPIAKK
jgi:hypothetical protein